MAKESPANDFQYLFFKIRLPLHTLYAVCYIGTLVVMTNDEPVAFLDHEKQIVTFCASTKPQKCASMVLADGSPCMC